MAVKMMIGGVEKEFESQASADEAKANYEAAGAAATIGKVTEGGADNATYAMVGKFMGLVVKDAAKDSGIKSKLLTADVLSSFVEQIDDDSVQGFVTAFREVVAANKALRTKHQSALKGGIKPITVADSFAVWLAPEGASAQKETSRMTIRKANVG